MIIAERFFPIFAKRRFLNIIFNIFREIICALPIVLLLYRAHKDGVVISIQEHFSEQLSL